MTLIAQESGCKVGWEIYDDEDEARAAGERARALAIDKASRGYDFGYQVPGTVRFCAQHHDRHDRTLVYYNVWEVVTP